MGACAIPNYVANSSSHTFLMKISQDYDFHDKDIQIIKFIILFDSLFDGVNNCFGSNQSKVYLFEINIVRKLIKLAPIASHFNFYEYFFVMVFSVALLKFYFYFFLTHKVQVIAISNVEISH